MMVKVKVLCWFAWLTTIVAVGVGKSVTYDGRSLIINGERKILFSGSIHYPRSTPEMWPSLISKAKAGGIDVIETYAFWNQHEPQPGQYNFSGRNDIVRFMKEIHAQGLYACLRIGPYIQAEWTYGGLPFWLHDVPGIVFRSDNEPFKAHMQNFTTKIVDLMKSEGLFASHGGPIILSQIENEYKTVEAAFRQNGPSYVRWAANMAVRLQTGVPWVMCKQGDAPDPVINACNGRKCGETFVGPNSPNKPSIWTENWTSAYEVFGDVTNGRSPQDIAFQVALFIARNGSFVNYYMYHGGTNFGRTGSAYVLTSYYDQAPIDEYGFLRQPKWGHLKELHAAIKLSSKPLLSGEYNTFSLGQLQQAYVFKGKSEKCAAFLVNADARKDAVVQFQNSSYELPRKSISILPDCKTEAFNTAKVTSQYSTRSMQPRIRFNSVEKWKKGNELVPNFDETSLKANRLLEQMTTTKDASDYLWYTLRFQEDSPSAKSVLKVKSLGHVLHAFVNGVFVGRGHGSFENKTFDFQNVVSLNKGMNNVSLLSVMVGLPNSGPYLERRVAGLRRVRLESENGVKDFTNNPWGYQVGLVGEKLPIYTDGGSNSIDWSRFESSFREPLTWYKTTFDAPPGSDPLALNLGSMGKGEAWVNGQSIGRYWVSFHNSEGKPSQTWYNVPRSFLKPKGNLLVLLEEEESGNPLGITIDTVFIKQVCGRVADSHLPPVLSWVTQDESDKVGDRRPGRRPKIQLSCSLGKYISRILFASFGTPYGDCGNYGVGTCHSWNSKQIVEKDCLWKTNCTVPLSVEKFGDPCPGIPKSLLVVAQCR